MFDYLTLQNGSDIRGVALSVPGGKDVNLTSEVVRNIGSAFAIFTAKRLKKENPAELRIAIGRDPRLTGEEIAGLLAAGITKVGANAFDGGLASTPAMFMCCVNELKFDAGVMITASHLPMERNGMKFFFAEGGLEKADIKEILSIAQSGEFNISSETGKSLNVDLMTPYINGLKAIILRELGEKDPDAKPFMGLKIAVDAGNGSGGFFAERLLKPLGADISGSRYLEPDGHFPNHQPNPENKQAMASIVEAVLLSGSDFGIIFDTDVDRAGAVLPDGDNVILLDRNRLIAMLTAILSRQYGPITVVTDSVTSTGLNEFITNLGCTHHRFKRGYRNVINEAKRLNAACADAIPSAKLAIETSGHGAMMENYFLDDGAYIIVKLLVELVRSLRCGRTLNALISDLKEPKESTEARLDVISDYTEEFTDKVLAHVLSFFEKLPGFSVVEPNFEGVRINADVDHGDGWFLLRRSLHDPLMPCNIESNSIGGVKLLASALLSSLAPFENINVAALVEISNGNY